MIGLNNLKRNKMKKETLEEVAENESEYLADWEDKDVYKKGFVEGAKWQQEQILEFLYSEITERRDYSASKMCEKVVEFIEQFKKK
jgi:response regulator RpfG family c-di-GMP phosphodiesterase